MTDMSHFRLAATITMLSNRRPGMVRLVSESFQDCQHAVQSNPDTSHHSFGYPRQYKRWQRYAVSVDIVQLAEAIDWRLGSSLPD